MIRKHTILLLVLTLMTTLLAPARTIFACAPSRSVLCPMMAAMQKAQKSACCSKKEELKAPTLSAPCCCNLLPAPEAPVLPEASLAGESPIFVLEAPTLRIPAPETMSIAGTISALETTAPRGPPMPFASLRAPPSFS